MSTRYSNNPKWMNLFSLIWRNSDPDSIYSFYHGWVLWWWTGSGPIFSHFQVRFWWVLVVKTFSSELTKILWKVWDWKTHLSCFLSLPRSTYAYLLADFRLWIDRVDLTNPIWWLPTVTWQTMILTVTVG